jgi:hypothetical protein
MPILAAVALAVGGILLGFLINSLIDSLRQDGQRAPSPATSRGQGPFQLEGELAEHWKAATTRWCPRLAALQWGDAGQKGRLVMELTSMECLSLLCDHPEKLKGVDPSAREQLKPVCERLGSLLGGQMAPLTENYRQACPEAVQTWSERTWSPSNHLGFYEDAGQCLERQCEGVDGGQGSKTRCELAADIAEGLGDARAAARLREQAQRAREQEKQLWGPLSEEEKKENDDEGMKVLAKRLLALCRQGNQRYCRSLAKYCELEGHPPDVCPAPATSDAGSR